MKKTFIKGGFVPALPGKTSFARRVIGTAKRYAANPGVRKVVSAAISETALGKLKLKDLPGIAAKMCPKPLNSIGSTVGSLGSTVNVHSLSVGEMSNSSTVYVLNKRRPSHDLDMKYLNLCNNNLLLQSPESATGVSQYCPVQPYGVTAAPFYLSYFISNIATQSATGNATGRIIYDTCSIRTTISNQESSDAILDIYEVVPKHDMSVATTFGTPMTAWQTGMAAMSGGTSTTYTRLSVKPTDSYSFNLFWKVIKKTSVEMSVGAVHTHNSHWELNSVVQEQRASYATKNMAGLTPWFLFVARGVPVTNTGQLGPIAIGKSRFAIEQEVTVKFRSPYVTGEVINDQSSYTALASEITIETGVVATTVT